MGRKLLVDGETSTDRYKRRAKKQYATDDEYREKVKKRARDYYRERAARDTQWRIERSEREKQRYKKKKNVIIEHRRGENGEG